jgi:hypothetical protein
MREAVTDVSTMGDTSVTELLEIAAALRRAEPGLPHWPWHACVECGFGFRAAKVDGRRKHARPEVRYCSNACQQRAYRKRSAASV